MNKTKKKYLIPILLVFVLGIGFLFAQVSTNENVNDTIIGPPTGFSAIVTSDGNVSLSWNAVDGANGYEVWQSMNGGNWNRVQIVSNSTSTQYTRMQTNVEYSFKIVAWSGSIASRNCGVYSNSLSLYPTNGASASAPDVAWTPPVENPPVETQPSVTPTPETTPIPTPNEETKNITSTPNVEENSKQENVVENTNPSPVPNIPIVPTTPNEKDNVSPKEDVTTNVVIPNVEQETKVEKNILLSSAIVENSISIAWTNTNVNCDGYEVWQSMNGGNWNRVQIITNNTKTNSTFSWLSRGVEYSYKVISYTKVNGVRVQEVESNVVSETLPLYSKEETTTTQNPTTNAKPDTNSLTQNTMSNSNCSNGTTSILNPLTPSTSNQEVVKSVPYVNPTTNKESFSNDIYNGTNLLRESLGLNALVVDKTLMQMAQERANDMANKQYFSHYYDGTLQLRVVRTNFGYSTKVSLGENIARTTATENIGNRFVVNWINSSSHYENMTNTNWTKIGIGMAQDSTGRWYGVQIFSE